MGAEEGLKGTLMNIPFTMQGGVMIEVEQELGKRMTMRRGRRHP